MFICWSSFHVCSVFLCLFDHTSALNFIVVSVSISVRLHKLKLHLFHSNNHRAPLVDDHIWRVRRMVFCYIVTRDETITGYRDKLWQHFRRLQYRFKFKLSLKPFLIITLDAACKGFFSSFKQKVHCASNFKCEFQYKIFQHVYQYFLKY